MSASPMARQATGSAAIPIKKVLINDASELPSYYSSTPGGTLFSTTPGGAIIMYEKSILMNLRDSPISNTPPQYQIPNDIQKDTDSCGGIPRTGARIVYEKNIQMNMRDSTISNTPSVNQIQNVLQKRTDSRGDITNTGARIVYEKNILMNLRDSPISSIPLDCGIPNVLQKSTDSGGVIPKTGARIVYEKNVLMNLRDSPISNSPPDCKIPNILQKGTDSCGDIPKTGAKIVYEKNNLMNMRDSPISSIPPDCEISNVRQRCIDCGGYILKKTDADAPEVAPLKRSISVENIVSWDGSDYASTLIIDVNSLVPDKCTKIVYEKNILLNLRNSPISNTPPEYQIPDVLQKGTDRCGGIPKKPDAGAKKAHQKGAPPKRNQKNHHKVNDTHEDQFEIEL